MLLNQEYAFVLNIMAEKVDVKEVAYTYFC